MSQSIPCHAVVQEDVRDLLPPATSDRSQLVPDIRSAIAAKDLTSAQARIDLLVSREPTNFEGFFWRGFLEFQQGNYVEAVRSLRHGQALDANIYVLKLLGLSYYFLNQFRLFTAIMQQVIQKQPADFAPYYYLGRYFVSTEVADFHKAEKYFDEAIQRSPNYSLSHYYLGYCDEFNGKLAQAEHEYFLALDLSDGNPQNAALATLGLARLRLLENKASEALTFAEKAIGLNPSDPSAHIVLARIYTGLHRRNDALAEWERAARLDQTNPAPLYHLYRLYLEMGKRNRAEEAFAKYKDIVAIYGTN